MAFQSVPLGQILALLIKITPALKFARYKHSSLSGRATCDKENIFLTLTPREKYLKLIVRKITYPFVS